jgi:hypothetical protein
MSVCIKLEDLTALLNPYIVVLKDFEKLGATPFRLNAFNGVFAPAKSGKTHFVLEQLNTLDSKIYTTIWLDGDRNSELKDKFGNIQHFPLSNTSAAFNDLLESEQRYDQYIFIVDSYKDFSFGKDTDSNRGSQEVFETYQQLLNLGATIVIIFHSTKLYDGGGDFKLKGNADTIESKMDFLYKLRRTKDNIVNLTVTCSREAGLNIGDVLSFGNKDKIKSLIIEYITAEPDISLRDLKKKSGLTMYESMIDELQGILFDTVDIKSEKGGRPKKGVKLI